MTTTSTDSQIAGALPGPLGHLRVVEVAEMVAAPYTGRLLTDLGAAVTKVERPGRGDGARYVGPFPEDRPDPEAGGLFAYLNRGKRSVTLDSATATGTELLDRLLDGADLLISDERFGRTHEELVELTERHAGLSVVSITPFGLEGPRSHWRGSHSAICAYGGLTLYNGEQDREPICPPFDLGNYQAGLTGAISTMLAVHARHGAYARGQVADIAVTDVLSTIHTGNSATHWVFGSRSWIRHGRRSAGGLYPNTMLRCKDGWFRIQAMSRKEWRGLLNLVGDPDWGEDPRFQDRIVMQANYADELDGLIEDDFRKRTKQELFDASQERELPFSPVREMHEVNSEQQLVGRDFFDRARLPDGRELQVPGVPYRRRCGDGEVTGGASMRPVQRAPALGQHNAEVYSSLGLSDTEQHELLECGVI